MGSIWLYIVCPLKSPKRAASAFGATWVSGEKEKWKKTEKRQVPERGQTCKYMQFHTDLPSGSQRCHIVRHCLIWKLYSAKRRSSLGDTPPTGSKQQQHPYSIANRGCRTPVLLQQSPEHPEPCWPHTQTPLFSERANTPSREGKTQILSYFKHA